MTKTRWSDTRRRDLVAAIRRMCLAVVAGAVVPALVACTAGPGGNDAVDDDPEPTLEVTKPTLIGTWSGTGDYWKHDDRTNDYYIAGIDRITLTFTKERYIRTHSSVSFDGVESVDGYASGTWEATDDSTLTRTWMKDHDYDDTTPRIDVSVAKDYYLQGDTGNVLYMHDFGDAEPTTLFRRYERVENPLPSSSLAGVWTTMMDEDGFTRRIIINADGTLQLVDARINGEEHEAVIDAKWTLDADNYYLNLTDATRSDGEPAMADRIAFAPTGNSPNEMAVSFYWHETETDEFYEKYGDYWMVFHHRSTSQ